MQTLHPNVTVVNPPPAWVSVDQEPGGTYQWVINRTGGKLGTTSRASFLSFDAAADAAVVIAEAYGLPLAADVSIFVEMASPWYSGHEHEMAEVA